MTALGLTARSAFHYLRKNFPKAFIVVQVGTGRFTPTRYDKAAIDNFIQWRKMKKTYDHYVQARDKYTKE